MDVWSSLMGGFASAATPINLLWALLGCTIGTAVGVLPGIGPALTVAMLLPLTGQVEPTASMILFAGIYYGAMYGGSTTSILLNTPGETATMVTAMEGNLMAKNGRAGAALATAAIGSFVAGTIATILLTLFAPWLAEVALRFGPPEYFALMVLAFITVSSVLGASALRGVTALFIGLAIGLIGMDEISGVARYTLGVPELVDRIEVTLVAVGLFAVGEAMFFAVYEGRRVEGDVREAAPGELGEERAKPVRVLVIDRDREHSPSSPAVVTRMQAHFNPARAAGITWTSHVTPLRSRRSRCRRRAGLLRRSRDPDAPRRRGLALVRRGHTIDASRRRVGRRDAAARSRRRGRAR